MESSSTTSNVNANRLFYASCFALITTAFSFAIAAGILDQLKTELGLTAGQAGIATSMWFLGFPISMVIGGLIYHKVGGKIIMQFAFLAHTAGIILTIYSGGYVGLLISTFLIGLGNGCTEAACNPMIAGSATGKKMNTLMNRFHMWFPGGIVLGSLISYGMTKMELGWQAQIWIILVPTIIYAFLLINDSVLSKSFVAFCNCIKSMLSSESKVSMICSIRSFCALSLIFKAFLKEKISAHFGTTYSCFTTYAL